MSFSGEMAEQTMVHACEWILVNKMEGASDPCNYMEESQKHDAEWKKKKEFQNATYYMISGTQHILEKGKMIRVEVPPVADRC